MIIKNDRKHNSQFFKGCNTDWNLNNEFIHWINHWFKEFEKEASKVVDLECHRYKYKRREMTQLEIIDRIIELSDKFISNEFEKEDVETVDEIFDLFHLVFWNMWW